VQVWEEVLAVFPDAYFLHVVRDPRSVFCSHRSAARSWADPTRFSHDVYEVAEEWVGDVTRARAIAGATPRYLEVRYESLRREPARELATVLRWLELPADDALCARAVAACSLERMRSSDHAPRGFFRTGEVSAWQSEMSARAVRALECVAGPLMRELGYETVTRAGSRPPLTWTWRLRKRALAERLQAWAWESKGPLRRAAAQALRFVPGARGAFLRRIPRPDRRRAA
jgi:hypothetical protein